MRIRPLWCHRWGGGGGGGYLDTSPRSLTVAALFSSLSKHVGPPAKCHFYQGALPRNFFQQEAVIRDAVFSRSAEVLG